MAPPTLAAHRDENVLFKCAFRVDDRDLVRTATGGGWTDLNGSAGLLAHAILASFGPGSPAGLWLAASSGQQEDCGVCGRRLDEIKQRLRERVVV
jgi:hypothetical protein